MHIVAPMVAHMKGLRSVRRPYVGLSKPTLDGFCDGHKDYLQLYRLLSTVSTVDHVKNAQSCVNRVNAHRGTYGGTYENRSSFSTCLQDPKSYIDLGYGRVLWPHSVLE
jgi:hypothetical protein